MEVKRMITKVEAKERGYNVPSGCLAGFIDDNKFLPVEVYAKRMSPDSPSTLGERRVGYAFNPTQNLEVEYIKILAAQRIDALEASRTDGYSEKNRTIARAQTAIEDGCMLAIKSISQ